MEDRMWKKGRMKTSFRLGDLQYANSLEYPVVRDLK